MYCYIQSQRRAPKSKRKLQRHADTQAGAQDQGMFTIFGDKIPEGVQTSNMSKVAATIALSCLIDLCNSKGAIRYESAAGENVIAGCAIEEAKVGAERDTPHIPWQQHVRCT